jgi:hypothetical protein
MRDFRDERVIGIRIRKHGADAQKHYDSQHVVFCNREYGLLALGDGESRAPLVSQDIQADATI